VRGERLDRTFRSIERAQGDRVPRLHKEIVIAAAPDEVWASLHDPHFVASCVPGAQLQESIGENSYNGTLEVSFGPKRVTFGGEVTYSFDEATRRCELTAKGADSKRLTLSSARTTVSVRAFDGAPSPVVVSVVQIESVVEATGPLSQFIETGGVHVGNALLDDFAKHLDERLQLRSSRDEPEVAAAAAAPNAAASGWRLMRAALRSSISGGWIAMRRRFSRQR
jgi:carbon monoxide dehydrogenase subunit G